MTSRVHGFLIVCRERSTEGPYRYRRFTDRESDIYNRLTGLLGGEPMWYLLNDVSCCVAN